MQVIYNIFPIPRVTMFIFCYYKLKVILELYSVIIVEKKGHYGFTIGNGQVFTSCAKFTKAVKKSDT